MVGRVPRDGGVAGDRAGKGDASDVKGCPRIAGYNGRGGDWREHLFLRSDNTENRRPEEGGRRHIPKRRGGGALQGQKRFSPTGGGDAAGEANLGRAATLPR